MHTVSERAKPAVDEKGESESDLEILGRCMKAIGVALSIPGGLQKVIDMVQMQLAKQSAVPEGDAMSDVDVVYGLL